ncbi:hypothetical protein ACSV9I_21530 [Rhizobium sp. G187]|uniref:hypothetical protein n=1 Tax=Rhizobium sp. G187 TaxID=3451352 RepID=UPI003EE6F5CA
MAKVKITSNYTMSLSTAELGMLRGLIESGDRAAFYMAYHAMTGSSEALLTGKISTFSETTGGTAFAANWLLQDQYREGGPTGQDAYSGIYFLSQQVALQSYAAILEDAIGVAYSAEDGDLRFDGIADGIVTDTRLFNSSFNGWDLNRIEFLFPGNMLVVGLLPAYTYLENPDSLSIAEATVRRRMI